MGRKKKETEAATAATGAQGAKKPIRLTHHTERVAFPADGKKAKAYFKGLEEGHSRCYCTNRIHDPYRSEIAFYQERYGEAAEARNLAHKKHRHPGRMFSIQDLHRKKRTCPEELTIQAGGKGGAGSPPPDVFRGCVMRYVSWMREWGEAHGGCLHVLGAYISKDEPHRAIIRRVWDCPGKNGLWEVNMVGALKMAGVPCPKQGEDEDTRFNNRKITFDRISREALYQCFEDAGVAVNREPMVYTLRRALEIKEGADMEEQQARDVLREIMEVEAQAPPMGDGADIPGIAEGPDGTVQVPEGDYRMLKIRQCLAGAYAAREQAAGMRLLGALEDERAAQKAHDAQAGILAAAELGNARLRLGILRCGYYAGDGDMEGGDFDEGIAQQHEAAGLGEP